MKQLRTHGDTAFAADRQRADDAGREQPVDVRTVLYAVQAKMAAGLVEEARELVRQYREGK